MADKGPSGRSLKKKIIEILDSPDMDSALEELRLLPVRKSVNQLFSLLYSSDQNMKWKAVRAMGVLVDMLAKEDEESARVILRRLMWNLNDESGGIGWGSAEAMGEILANNDKLAGEYSAILLSYAREDGNYQELESMQRGVLHGIGRLAQVRPDLIKEGVPFILPFINTNDATLRGTAAWILGLAGDVEAIDELESLLKDESEIQIYAGGGLFGRRVKDIAKEAIEKILN
ncbi:DVU0298 family protein [Thermodesulfobacteriota bacterium]